MLPSALPLLLTRSGDISHAHAATDKLQLDPAIPALQYGVQCFEGMKVTSQHACMHARTNFRPSLSQPIPGAGHEQRNARHTEWTDSKVDAHR